LIPKTSDNSKKADTITALVRDETGFAAVELAERNRRVEILRSERTGDSAIQWKNFAAEFGLISESSTAHRSKQVIVGYDGSGVAFYRFQVPPVKPDEMDSLVRMQLEARLPIDIEKMQTAWRADTNPGNTKAGVTVAAARTAVLEGFIAEVRLIRPDHIVLQSEAIVELWRRLYGGTEAETVLLDFCPGRCRVCLVKNARLIDEVTVYPEMDSYAVENEAEVWADERFVQDLRSVLGRFGYQQPSEAKVQILGSEGRFEALAGFLTSNGIDVREVTPNMQKIAGTDKLENTGIYEYRHAIGAALTAEMESANQLNLFAKLYQNSQSRGVGKKLHSVRWAAATLAAAGLLLVVAIFAADVAAEKHWSRLSRQADFEELSRRQQVIKTVARNRVEILELLERINTNIETQVDLNQFDFSRGRPVSISGNVKDNEALYSFQKELLGKNGISDVQIRSASPEEKKHRVNFTITFHYKNVTGKD